MNLPQPFLTRMQSMLPKEEYEAFLQSYDIPRSYGLRFNPLKGNLESTDCLPFILGKIPWAKYGYFADASLRPGKHPLHEAGVYYIQEPSAMITATLLDPKPGDFICDLCAAPGGKSTQVAALLQRLGLLVSNEIHPARAKILSQNVERLGITNDVVCNEDTGKMASLFPFFFDGIIVDAPCSGEGMFRKDENACLEWSLEHVRTCADRQKEILNNADLMLKPGGTLVYSTCTFAPEEDEEMIAWFLKEHPDYVLENWQETSLGKMVSSEENNAGLRCGNPAYSKIACSQDLSYTLRLWPQKLNGEGHFAARLHKQGEKTPNIVNASLGNLSLSSSKKKKKKGITDASKNSKNQIADYTQFCATYLHNVNTKNMTKETTVKNNDKDTAFIYVNDLLRENPRIENFGEEQYLVPKEMISLNGIRILRAGLHLGTCKKNRFEPSHALALALRKEEVTQYKDCTLEEATHYLKGESLTGDESFKGWVLLGYNGYSLGWAKANHGILKNHYPKGLRWF